MQRMTPPRGMVPLGPQVNNQCRKLEAEFFAFYTDYIMCCMCLYSFKA